MEDAVTLARAIVDGGGMATPIHADLEDSKQLASLLDRCNTMAPLRCLVNNASFFPLDIPSAIDPSLWRPVMQVNLRTPVTLTSHLYELLKASHRRGVVVNILDNKLMAMNPDYFTYTLSKAGLRTATEAMAMAFGSTLRCAGIAPGITLPSPLQTMEDFQVSHDANPLNRGCGTDDILAAARFIVTTESFSGQVLTIDGGLHLARPERDIVFLDQ